MNFRILGLEIHQLAFLFAVIVYLLLSLISFNQIEEDAYIYMKTAANLAEGYGYVFNRVDPPVETGSSTLWQFLVTFIYFLPGTYIVNIKLFGLLIGVTALFVTHRISQSLLSDSKYHWLPVLMTAVNVPFIVHNQAGLDYGLTTLIYLFFCWLCIDVNRFRFWPIGALLVLMVRSEGFFMLILLLPVLFIQQQEQRKKITGFIYILLAFILIEVVRLLYFKDFLPSPFYKKWGQSDVDTFIINAFWKSHYLVLIFPIIISGLLFGGLRKRSYLIVILFVLVCVLWGGLSGDHWHWSRRILPAIPLIYVLASHSMVSAFSRLKSSAIRTPCILVSSLAFVILSGVLTEVTLFYKHKSGGT